MRARMGSGREDGRRLREPGPCDVDQARIKAALGRGCVKTPDCSGRREPISTVARDLCANSDFSPIKPDFSQCSSRRQNDFLVPKLPGAFSHSLGRRLLDMIRTKNMTQLAVAEILGVDQPKVSRLLRGELREFSTPRLLRFLALLGQDIDIVVRDPSPAERRAIGQLRVVARGGSHR
jgi:predicted XRE-type DNA-binding protein